MTRIARIARQLNTILACLAVFAALLLTLHVSSAAANTLGPEVTLAPQANSIAVANPFSVPFALVSPTGALDQFLGEATSSSTGLGAGTEHLLASVVGHLNQIYQQQRQIQEVQQRLDALGYYSGPTDGLNSPQLSSSIEKFEANNGVQSSLQQLLATSQNPTTLSLSAQTALAQTQSEESATVAQLEAYAAALGQKLYGWNPVQMSDVDQIFVDESQWSWSAANSSGAYGIPQALPGSKMASAGADWQTNPYTQIKWGLAYIAGTYAEGNVANAPANALTSEETRGHY